MRVNIIREKTYSLALRTIKISDELNEKCDFELSRQLLRSGTSIGASVRESKYAESKKDFVHKLKIALKEADETDYWTNLLYDSGKLDLETYHDQIKSISEVIKILERIVISTLKNMKENN